MPSPLTISEEALRAFCERWQIVELDIFGFALRPDFGPDSDIDLLVTYAPDARWSLFDEARMQEELERLLDRPVDLVSRRAVEESPNWIRRKSILESAEPIYVATK